MLEVVSLHPNKGVRFGDILVRLHLIVTGVDERRGILGAIKLPVIQSLNLWGLGNVCNETVFR